MKEYNKRKLHYINIVFKIFSTGIIYYSLATRKRLTFSYIIYYIKISFLYLLFANIIIPHFYLSVIMFNTTLQKNVYLRNNLKNIDIFRENAYNIVYKEGRKDVN